MIFFRKGHVKKSFCVEAVLGLTKVSCVEGKKKSSYRARIRTAMEMANSIRAGENNLKNRLIVCEKIMQIVKMHPNASRRDQVKRSIYKSK